jgi:hypothetical protein
MSSILYPSKFVRFEREYDNEFSIHNARDLCKLWTEAKALSDPDILMPIEADTIRRVLRMSKSAMESEIDFHMNKKLELFDSVGKQIESLMVFWERIMWIKKRLDSLNRWDEKGKQHKFRCEDAVDAQCCLLGLSIIPSTFKHWSVNASRTG